MNSRQYEKMMKEVCENALNAAGIKEGEYTGACLSSDRTEYEVFMLDGSVKVIPSGLDYFED